MAHRLSLGQIARAMEIIDPVFLNSPQYRAESLEEELGCRVLVKVESVNPIRCFKGRGSSFAVAQLAAGARVVCASAGNFGQAMAYACRARDLPCRVYASTGANVYKVERNGRAACPSGWRVGPCR